MSHQTGKLEILKKGHIPCIKKGQTKQRKYTTCHRFKQKNTGKEDQNKPGKNKK